MLLLLLLLLPLSFSSFLSFFHLFCFVCLFVCLLLLLLLSQQPCRLKRNWSNAASANAPSAPPPKQTNKQTAKVHSASRSCHQRPTGGRCQTVCRFSFKWNIAPLSSHFGGVHTCSDWTYSANHSVYPLLTTVSKSRRPYHHVFLQSSYVVSETLKALIRAAPGRRQGHYGRRRARLPPRLPSIFRCRLWVVESFDQNSLRQERRQGHCQWDHHENWYERPQTLKEFLLCNDGWWWQVMMQWRSN